MASIQSIMKAFHTNPIRLNSDALATLAADTALIVNATFSTGLTRTFLLKFLDYHVRVVAGTPGESVIVGLAIGQATIAEIAAALTGNITDPSDAVSLTTMAARAAIIWPSVRILDLSPTGGAKLEERIPMGKKGIPLQEENGMQIFVYNPSTSSLTTGALLNGIVGLTGVWLDN